MPWGAALEGSFAAALDMALELDLEQGVLVFCFTVADLLPTLAVTLVTVGMLK